MLQQWVKAKGSLFFIPLVNSNCHTHQASHPARGQGCADMGFLPWLHAPNSPSLASSVVTTHQPELLPLGEISAAEETEPEGKKLEPSFTTEDLIDLGQGQTEL